jgi:ergothioneine biosynthesis protein EgtB
MKDTVRNALLRDYRQVRQASIAMCEPMAAEAFRVQPIEEVSPPWWNLGHTSWFFARNVLQPLGGQYTQEDEDFDYVLNSYYMSLGPRIRRNRRGLVTQPDTEQVYHYRASVDERIERLAETIDAKHWEDFAFLMTVGVHHEQQHQELFYTEIKYILGGDPPRLRRPYRPSPHDTTGGPETVEMNFIPFDGGLYEFGNLEGGWCWDNELPVHKYYLHDFALADRLVTCGEFLCFIEDGAYNSPLLWLDNGWRQVEEEGWQAPLYWEKIDGQWHIWTLSGVRPIDPAEPVCHVSFYEADALARWMSSTSDKFRRVRLPSEREWEYAARIGQKADKTANFLDSGRLHPASAVEGDGLKQMLGDCWEWTSSYYEPYPGYVPFPGVLSEYNGKFMDNQRTMRGGSCVTPQNHMRLSYRSVWAANTRFQFTGIRLGKDGSSA